MKVGILFTSHPDPKSEPYPHQSIHQRVTREVLEAEKLGFDSVWIAEHHFSNSYGILPDPFSYLSYLAAKTTRIKLGAAVMVVPLHHPMRIVENAAFVDILSDGRFQLGLGSGYRPYEFEGLGIDYEARREIQQEAIPLILQGFHEKRINADGKHFNFSMDDQYEIFPQPLQQPHPPFYMGAGTNDSMAFAGRESGRDRASHEGVHGGRHRWLSGRCHREERRRPVRLRRAGQNHYFAWITGYGDSPDRRVPGSGHHIHHVALPTLLRCAADPGHAAPVCRRGATARPVDAERTLVGRLTTTVPRLSMA